MNGLIASIPEEYRKGLYYSDDYRSVVVPKRYGDRIVSHIVANYLPNNHFFTPPLYLAIQGAPGEGKTFQTIAACNQRGIMVKYLSASELSGELEAASLEAIRTVYEQAQKLQELGYYICILLDDFHLGNSNIKGNANHTVNAELLTGYMMNLAEVTDRRRVPIILTGNDFSNTYDALLRDGRTDFFEWTPSKEEKMAVTRSILTQFIPEGQEQQLDAFLKKYAKKNVAFFSQIKTDIRREILCKSLEEFERITPESLYKIGEFINKELKQVDVSTLYRLAEERIESRRRGGL